MDNPSIVWPAIHILCLFFSIGFASSTPERCRFMVYLMIHSLTIDIRKINQLKQLFG